MTSPRRPVSAADSPRQPDDSPSSRKSRFTPNCFQRVAGSGVSNIYPRIVLDEAPKPGDDVWLMFSVGTLHPAKVVAVDTVSWPSRARVTRSDTGEMLVVPVLGHENRDPHVRDGMHDSWDADAAQRRRMTPPLEAPVRKDTEASSSSARGQMPPLILPPRDGGEKRGGHPTVPHSAPRPDGAHDAKCEPSTMTSIYQVFEDNFDLVTPRMETTPRYPERDDDGKASGKQFADGDSGNSGSDAIRKLRDELREDVRRGHSFLKSELQRVLYAQDRRLSSRLDLLEARIDKLQGVGSAGGGGGSGQYPPLLADSPRQRHVARDVGGARQYTDEQITPVRRELQAIRQEVEAQRALGKVMGTM